MNHNFKQFFFILLFLFRVKNCFSTQELITIIGSGYVGLTFAAALLEKGYSVTCIDKDKSKIDSLLAKKLYIYEPGLEKLFFSFKTNNHINFGYSVKDVQLSEIYYICVPTPLDSHFHCDLSFLYSALNEVIEACDKKKNTIICIKSTIPPGTMQKLLYIIKGKKASIELLYNPEFMREGSAFIDISKNPIIIGGESIYAIEKIKKISKNLAECDNVPCLITSFITAEMIKYSWNSYAALRISYINELGYLSYLLNANIKDITKALSLNEDLLPTSNISPGPGFGGSCLPKDTQAFLRIFEDNNFVSSLIGQVVESNKNHKQKIVKMILDTVNSEKKEPIVTLWGLSFKANTNDIRYAPSIDIIEALLAENICVKAYDPKANKEMSKLFPKVMYYDSPYDAAKESNCIVVLTEWEEIKKIDMKKVAHICATKKIVDTRNIFNPLELCAFDFEHINMGLQ